MGQIVGAKNQVVKAEQLLRQSVRTGKPAEDLVFSMEDAERQAFNELFARRILANLGLARRFEELEKYSSKPLDLGVKAA